ncbi:AMP-binding protein [Parasphingorhabdus sp. JC815]|uniref:class I adenylate-forming enzyme family protein n=1 Tax=Parasphingorhabdus sp. JC815 TaxID=3232140 RepID=UPI00345B0AC5
MSRRDPVYEALTASGTPFEIGEQNGMRQFVNAPPDINILVETARRHGDKVFVVEGDRRLTFDELFSLRDALVPALEIKRGDRVAICMCNRTEWMIAFLAVARANGVSALVNSRGSPEELNRAVNDVSPALVLADKERAKLLRAGGYDGRILEIDDFPSSGPELPDFEPAHPDDPCTILFTSGTTGQVKGAVLSHRNLINGLMSVQMTGMMVLHDTAAKLDIPVEQILANLPQQGALLVSPLFHISGLGASFLSPLCAGSKIVIMPRWDANEATRLIEREQITAFSGVPTMMWDMLRGARETGADLGSLRNIASGGQALPVALLDEIRAMCPGAVMGTGYGMTETSGSISMAVGEDFIRNRAAAGRVTSLVDVRIEGPGGEELPSGETGEIVVRGPIVMQGYWNNKTETDKVLSADGWLKTGDIGYVDEEGYIFIVDRKKDMVISGGENIYCAEVERIIGGMDDISECAAFGIPDERLGELLVTVVVQRGEYTAADIINTVGERLARYKAPADVVFTEEPLPRNDVGKVNKNKLRAAWPHISGAE